MKKLQLTDSSFPQQISSKFESFQHLPSHTEGSAFGAAIGQFVRQNDLLVSPDSLRIL